MGWNSMTERIAIFVDGNSVYMTTKSQGWNLNISKIQDVVTKELTNSGTIPEVTAKYWYQGVLPMDKPFAFLKMLGYNGYHVWTRDVRTCMQEGHMVDQKGNMDVELTVDVVDSMDKYDTAVLFSGDSDFTPMVTFLQTHHKRVVVISSMQNTARELKAAADLFLEIEDLQTLLRRDPDQK
jgi:uncharacterized LabA/DUF88 family protein